MQEETKSLSPFRIERERNCLEQIKYHEGFRANVYKCPAGKRTIGYGHNLDANPLPLRPPITRDEAKAILIRDCDAIAGALDKAVPWWRRLSPPRQAVILNMAFNLGTRKLLGFHTTLACIEAGDYQRAASCMADSLWHRQVGRRALMLEEQMRSGEWQ